VAGQRRFAVGVAVLLPSCPFCTDIYICTDMYRRAAGEEGVQKENC